MAEVKDREETPVSSAPRETGNTALGGQAQADRAASIERMAAEKKLRAKRKRARRIKRIITLIVVLAILAGIAYGLYVLLRDEEQEIMFETQPVTRGSIQSMVSGLGRATPKESANITLTTGGTVLEVYVKDGDWVNEGDPLYVIDSSTAIQVVEEAQKTLNNYQKQLDAIMKSYNDLTVHAEYSGTLIDIADISPGNLVPAGMKIATLVNDRKMKLELYFSYAYEDMITVGQTALVSIPSVMNELQGTVTEINYVRRVTPEGSVLFHVVIELDNPGSLADKMGASATLTDSGGESIYPYGPGELTYSRKTDVLTKAGGKALSVNLLNYAQVSAGDLLLQMEAESNDEAVAALENQIKTAQENLERAQKNLENFNAAAPMSGTVISCTLVAGETVESGSVAVSIANTTEMIIEARVDEMNITYVKPGMFCDISFYSRNETIMFPGTVESVSMEIKFADNMSYFPARIKTDNFDGVLMPNVEVYYSMMASQSDNCLIAPMQAVKYTAEGECLFVKSETRPENALDTEALGIEVPDGFYAVPVTIGISDDYSVEIISGVEEGAEVFTRSYESQEGMRPGMGVMIG